MYFSLKTFNKKSYLNSRITSSISKAKHKIANRVLMQMRQKLFETIAKARMKTSIVWLRQEANRIDMSKL